MPGAAHALILSNDDVTAACVRLGLEPLESRVLRAHEWPAILDVPTRQDAAVVIADISSGIDEEILDRLRAVGLPLVILLSSAVDEVLAQYADDFVVQPFDVSELALRVRRLLRAEVISDTPLLRIYLAGGLRVHIGDRVAIDAHYPRRRAKALLLYLYLNRGRALSKYQIVADLWPEAEAADPGRVKHTVQVLRSALERRPRPRAGWSYILERDGAYAVNTEARRWTDLEEFESELEHAARIHQSGRGNDALIHYGRAFALRGDGFMTDFRYDDWAANEIARLQELFLEALDNAAHLEADQGAHDRAVDLLRRAVREDPLREPSYIELMRQLWLAGRRVEALRAYHSLRTALARTLDVAPQARATRLYEAIRRDEALAV